MTPKSEERTVPSEKQSKVLRNRNITLETKQTELNSYITPVILYKNGFLVSAAFVITVVVV